MNEHAPRNNFTSEVPLLFSSESPLYIRMASGLVKSCRGPDVDCRLHTPVV